MIDLQRTSAVLILTDVRIFGHSQPLKLTLQFVKIFNRAARMPSFQRSDTKVVARCLPALTSIAAASFLSACGTYTPKIQEPWSSDTQAQIRESDLVRLVRCETGIALQRAFRGDIAPEYAPSPGHPVPKPDLSWLEKWGVQVSMTLTVVENSSLTPTLTVNKILQNAVTPFPINGAVTTPQSFSLAVSGTLSSTATRVNVLHLFYKVADLRKSYFAKNENGDYIPCTPPSHSGTLFVENNFGIYEWLKGTLLPQYTEVGDYYQASLGQKGQNGISTEIKFQVVSSGSVTPTWRFVSFNNAGSGPLFGTGRDRTQDIIITLGPLDSPTPNGKGAQQLAATALSSHFALQNAELFGSAVRTPQ